MNLSLAVWSQRQPALAALVVAALLAAAGCSDAVPPGAGRDAGSGSVDAARGAPDASTLRSDAGPADGASETDAGLRDGGAGNDAGPASRCAREGAFLVCEKQKATLLTGFSGLVPRDVHHQTPLGDAPTDGWPVAILFQGSFAAAPLFWAAYDDEIAGAIHQVELVQQLLDAGFAVLTPEAHLEGLTAWDTNGPSAYTWTLSADHQFMTDIFDAIDEGTFGPLNGAQLFASGISSGGYMSSRMTLAYPERVRAIAIHSGSYATCAGLLCNVPDALPASHAPTLFLHGEADAIVPFSTVAPYSAALTEAGIPTQTITASDAGHEWIPAAPNAVTEWFLGVLNGD